MGSLHSPMSIVQYYQINKKIGILTYPPYEFHMILVKVVFNNKTMMIKVIIILITQIKTRVCVQQRGTIKQNVMGSVKKLARNSSKSTRTFSATGKFFLFVFSILGFFLLLAVLAQRKKMSTEDALIEEAAVKKVGLEMKYLPRIALGLIFVIAF